jgi:hypothetical protein
MRQLLRFLWHSTRGHRLAPWRSPYLRWRMETYSGLKMDKIGFVEFWGFMLRERKQLRRFLKWTAEMDNYARPKPKNPQHSVFSQNKISRFPLMNADQRKSSREFHE